MARKVRVVAVFLLVASLIVLISKPVLSTVYGNWTVTSPWIVGALWILVPAAVTPEVPTTTIDDVFVLAAVAFVLAIGALAFVFGKKSSDEETEYYSVRLANSINFKN